MPKETQINNKISFKEYFDSRFSELKNYMDVKFNSIEKSTCLAQDNLNARLESMNEFRLSLKDQATNFVTKAEHEMLINRYDADIRMLRETNAKAEGKASQQSVNIVYLISFIGIVIGILSLAVKLI